MSMNVQRTFAFLNQTGKWKIPIEVHANRFYSIPIEGRDKFCKAIQYMSRFIKFQAAGNNDVVAKAFGGLLGK